MMRLYELGAYKRAALIWAGFMAVLWTTFGVSTVANPGAYSGAAPGPASDPMGGLELFGFIAAVNLLGMLLIAAGNWFVRFGPVTPGLLILALKGVQIGWLAGANGFETPFATMLDANLAFLRVGLWETSAYALVCAATLTRSLYVADSFPARRWTETRRLPELRPVREEWVVLALAAAMWLGAAVSEALSLL